MKFLFSIVLVIGMCSNSFAHKYYFGFAEVEYNTFTLCFEATLSLTAHDFERTLKNEGTDAGDLISLTNDQRSVVENYINNTFVIESGGEKSVFKLVGHESKLDGVINLYLESAPLALTDTLNITFNSLMEKYSEQQNKITLYCFDKIHTKAFTQRTSEQTIEINE